MFLHVGDRLPNEFGIIVECTHRGIAEQADDSAHGPGPVIVIDLFGLSPAAHSAQAALPPNKGIYLIGTDPVSSFQMVVTLATTVIAFE
ncbi:hypothetical protein BH20ACT23_BH20ACT23_04840 [soil metagenome]